MLPEYLAYGMTAEQYWDGDPKLAKAYKKAHLMKRKAANEQLWLQGLYIYDGIGALFNPDKRNKRTYPKEPYEVFELTEAEKEAKAERERKKIIDQLTAFKNAWDIKNG